MSVALQCHPEITYYLDPSPFGPSHHLSLNSTTENVAVFIWEQLAEALGDKRGLLYEVCVHETDSNTFLYRGE